jgi:amidase
MDLDEIAFLDATAQAELVRNKHVSATELVTAAIARINRLNPALNAVITPLFEQALHAASSVNTAAPFAGVPFVLKDLVADYAGAARSDGSGFLAGRHVSNHDSELVRRFKQAGLIILGKTNSSEFGLLPTTEPLRFGPTRNPWDLSRGTGGSSGGSSAAVATGMVAAGHANDGGGSIRIPASCCGLVGLKPTRGRNSLAPDMGDIAGGIICEHVVTRSVRDTAAILDATAGPMPGDPYIPPAPERPFAAEVGRAPGRLRIGFGSVSLNGVRAHPDCIAAVESTARLLEELGHEVEEASPQVDRDQLFRSFGAVMTGFLGWSIKAWARRTGFTPRESDFEPATWRTWLHSQAQTGGDYLLAWQDLQSCCREFAGFFSTHDAWLTPTLVKPPVPLGYFDYTHDTRKQYLEHLGHFTSFTLIANATGQPAISLPLHWARNEAGGSLPIGVQLTGRYGDEATLIRLAAQLEQALPWSHHRPPVSAMP